MGFLSVSLRWVQVHGGQLQAPPVRGNARRFFGQAIAF